MIIKQRNKGRSFKDDQEVQDWVFNMKLLYYATGPEAEFAPYSDGPAHPNHIDGFDDTIV